MKYRFIRPLALNLLFLRTPLFAGNIQGSDTLEEVGQRHLKDVADIVVLEKESKTTPYSLKLMLVKDVNQISYELLLSYRREFQDDNRNQGESIFRLGYTSKILSTQKVKDAVYSIQYQVTDPFDQITTQRLAFDISQIIKDDQKLHPVDDPFAPYYFLSTLNGASN